MSFLFSFIRTPFQSAALPTVRCGYRYSEKNIFECEGFDHGRTDYSAYEGSPRGCGLRLAKVRCGRVLGVPDSGGLKVHSDPRLLVGFDKSDDASV